MISQRSALAGVAALVLAAAFGPSSALGKPNAPEGAFAELAYDEDEPRVEARLLVDALQVAPGETLRAGVLFDLDPEWHLYWKNPGQTGLATEVQWNVSQGRAGPLRWPAPRTLRLSEDFITAYAYEGQVLLASQVRFDASAHGLQRIEASVDFLVCRVDCIPGTATLHRSVAVATPTTRSSSEAAIFDAYAARLPAAVEAAGVAVELRAAPDPIRPGDRFGAVLSVRSCVGDGAPCEPLRPASEYAWDVFIPEIVPDLELEAKTLIEDAASDAFRIELEGRASRDPPEGDAVLRGVLALRTEDGRSRPVAIELRLPRARAAAAEPAAAGPGLLGALLLGLLGGAILNLMPCVLPVLALKLFSVGELARRGRRAAIAHAAAYTAGVVGSMAILAGVVIGLRALGTRVGWGFHLQEPLFVAALAALMVGFALNLFGVFEIGAAPAGLARVGGVSGQASGVRRSFFEGLLVVALATPCSAPFLGTAVGFAFAGSAPVIVAVFAAIGLGLALPFAAAALVPGAARLVPRPGAWIEEVRAVLGFALLTTVVWLCWTAGRSAGSDFVSGLLLLLLAVAGLAWLYGRMQRRMPARGWPRAVALAGALLTGAGLAALPVPSSSPGAAAPEGHLRFDRAGLEHALSGGQPVFLYFTADWCITCKVNEHAVLADARVERELEALSVAVFQADWTRRDERIREALADFGRAGVPLYVVYSPDAPEEPTLLPELLSVDVLVRALRDAAASREPSRKGSRKRSRKERT